MSYLVPRNLLYIVSISPIAGEARQTDGSCTPCLAGTYSPLGDSSCTPCRVNMVSALPGASECSACVAPYQARLIGMKHCTLPFFKSKTAPGKRKDLKLGSIACLLTIFLCIAIKKPSTIVQELVVEEDKRTKQEGRSIKDLSTYLS